MEDNSSISATRRCIVGILCGRASLFLLMTGYVLFGAMLFESIEGGPQEQQRSQAVDFQKNREECLRELWLITERLNVLYEKNWTKLVTEQLRRFERIVVESKRMENSAGSVPVQWSFAEALLYSIALLTTVGYGKLSPKTALGKVATIAYSIIGVPLMLVLLSSLGTLLASGAKKTYAKLCCHTNGAIAKSPTVGYHKAPSSPAGKQYCRNHEDSASIQTSSIHNTPNHHANFRQNHHHGQHVEQGEFPKRSLLATVRSSHTRGRCRQTGVRQTLTEPTVPSMCPAHSHHHIPMRTVNSSIVGIAVTSDLEDAEEPDENDQITCSAHDTPSRVPLIWRSPEREMALVSPSSSSVPALLVFALFASYVLGGAAALSSCGGGGFLDAVYVCFVAVATIGIGDGAPTPGVGLLGLGQALAGGAYVFAGLVVVAMCFSLVQEEVGLKCRRIAGVLGLARR
ncbi:unnamed protein product [Phyllotreta striolata]|uniref:Potassium channel domain-containing protein n=1 Tax=Phyllotreta striolata TaxID=444603 RepID=A0A9N9XLB8_PHYSR|nr:unnamed protein product [Phyllotreta striolata]